MSPAARASRDGLEKRGKPRLFLPLREEGGEAALFVHLHRRGGLRLRFHRGFPGRGLLGGGMGRALDGNIFHRQSLLLRAVARSTAQVNSATGYARRRLAQFKTALHTDSENSARIKAAISQLQKAVNRGERKKKELNQERLTELRRAKAPAGNRFRHKAKTVMKLSTLRFIL